MVVDDIADIAKDLALCEGTSDLLGNHDGDGALNEQVRDALDESLKRMNGGGIWRAPRAWGRRHRP